MTYRDDLDAAHHRVEALEQEVKALVVTNQALARGGTPPRGRWRELIAPLAGTAATGAFTALSLTLAWGTWWAIAGFVLFAISLIVLYGTSDMPTGVIPVRRELEVSRDGTPTKVLLVAVVRQRTNFKGPPPFAGRTAAEISEAVADILEPVVRKHVDGDPTDAASQVLVTVGLKVVSIWIGPAS